MDNTSKPDTSLGLIGEFRRRFPLFDRIVGQFGTDDVEDMPAERIPWFFGFLLAAAKPEPGACCFVLDKTPGTTAIAATLTALAQLQSDFPRLVELYARTALVRGQRVKVRPSDFVYEYEGPWEEFPGHFRLKVLGEDAWRSFPLVDVLRLEPTDRVRPKGTGHSALGTFEHSELDDLLDLATCGNNSIIRNTVLVHMARTRFARVADAIILRPGHARRFARLSRFLPWGSIGHDGSLRPNDPYQVIGEPLVATTSVPEDLALACLSAEVATKTVFVDGASRLARDLQTFDDIVARQRMVILASPNESREIELLKDRECPIWYLSAGEILVGETSVARRQRASLVGATIRSADVRRRATVSTVDCHDHLLERAATLLEQVAEMIAENEEASEVEDALVPLFRILFECSESCFGAGAGTADDLRLAGEQVDKHARWLEPAVVKTLREAIGTLEQAIANGAAQEKADAFLSLLIACDGQWAVATRSPRTARRLQEELEVLGVDLPVFPVSAIDSHHEYSGIVVPGWPNDQRFSRLKNLAVTPEIRVLAYPFESKWVLRHQARERARMSSDRMSAEERSSILGVEPGFFTGLEALEAAESGAGQMTAIEIPHDLPVFRLEARVTHRRLTEPPVAADGEDTRAAQFVQFFGGCYALLTEWAELPLLNELIEGATADKARIAGVTVSRLSPGDFVLFRAGGDKEFIRLIAEEIVGPDEYRRIRDIAERWKLALQRLGSSPATVQRCLAEHGLNRTTVTVAGWLGDPDRIGPGNQTDIHVIAEAAGDTALLAVKDEVTEAISRIRGAHQAAGTRLTKLILGELYGRLHGLGDQPALLDLDYGQAWVVQVESIQATRREYPASQVNRLLWTADNAF